MIIASDSRFTSHAFNSSTSSSFPVLFNFISIVSSPMNLIETLLECYNGNATYSLVTINSQPLMVTTSDNKFTSHASNSSTFYFCIIGNCRSLATTTKNWCFVRSNTMSSCMDPITSKWSIPFVDLIFSNLTYQWCP
jgi:hypothetical protein